MLNQVVLNISNISTTHRLVLLDKCTVELHLSGLIGTTSHPDMHKIRITRFFFENRLHWQLEVRPLLFIVLPASKRFDHA